MMPYPSIRHASRIKFIFFLLLFLSSHSLSAQEDFRPGYIVNIAGDTLHGFIDYGSLKSNAKWCFFKRTREGDPRRYSPTELDSYRFRDSKFYVSKHVDLPIDEGAPKAYFLEYLVDGVIELYFLAHTFDDYFFLEKDGRLVQLSDKKEVISTDEGLRSKYVNPYTGVLKFVMKDAPTLHSQVDQSRLQFKDLIDLTVAYHDLVCTTGEECINYHRKKHKLHDSKLRVNLGLSAAYTTLRRRTRIGIYARDRFRYFTLIQNDTVRFVFPVEVGRSSHSPIGGTTRQSYWSPVMSLTISNKWRTTGQLDFQYHRNELSNGISKIQGNFLKSILSVNHELFFLSAFRPYLKAGILLNSVGYRMKNLEVNYIENDVNEQEQVINREESIYSANSIRVRQRPDLGVMIGAGFLYQFNSGRKIKLELGFDTGIDEVTSTKQLGQHMEMIIKNHLRNTTLALGVYF